MHYQTVVYDGRSVPRPLCVVPERKIPRPDYVPAGRRLHLVDIENLVQGRFEDPYLLALVVGRYQEVAPVGPFDHVVVAAHPRFLERAGRLVEGARLLVGHGPDGADLALLHELWNLEWTAARYDEVVLGSGDGIFAPVASEIRRLGVVVGVVGIDGQISRRLAEEASFVRRVRFEENEVAA